MRSRLLMVAVLCASCAEAAVRLPHLFSDGMILQRDRPVPVWGGAEPGEKVAVEFAGQHKSAKTGPDGRWSVTLDPMPAGTEPRPLVVAGSIGKQQSRIENVLVGDVFLCSGQSNMAMSMEACRRYPGTADDINAACLPQVRFFQAPNATFRESPQEDVEAKWEGVCPSNNAHFSAVAFYFARALHAHLKIPVGILRASHGGGSAEIKMPKEALLSCETGRKFHEDAMKRASPEGVAARNRIFQERYETAAREAKASGARPPEPPKPAVAVDGGYPCGDWNGVIAPVIRYGKRGIVWYQGEHNAGRAHAYREILPVLIRSWREASGDANLPFLFVQLPAYASPDNWPMLRESQLVALKVTTNTAMVVAIDHGEKDNIHPADKKPVGERLALEARRLIYGEQVSGCGPLYAGSGVQGTNLVVRFTNIGAGLQKPPGGRLDGFVVCGADRRFVPAEAVIADDTVVIHSPQVAHPVAARYAWAGFPAVSLFGQDGLPASPFRTDDGSGE